MRFRLFWFSSYAHFVFVEKNGWSERWLWLGSSYVATSRPSRKGLKTIERAVFGFVVRDFAPESPQTSSILQSGPASVKLVLLC